MSFCQGEWLNMTKREGRGQKEVEKRTDKKNKSTFRPIQMVYGQSVMFILQK